jgi:hypothetical protein
LSRQFPAVTTLSQRFMDHLSAQMARRFLGRALNQHEIVAAAQHLRVCEYCRENVIILRRNRPASLLDQILPGTSAEDHPCEHLLAAFVDDDLKPADCILVENHVSQCYICRAVLSDLRSFRDELKQMPMKQYLPAQKPGTRPISFGTRHSAGQESAGFFNWLRWFTQPFVIGVAITAAASLILVAFVSLRRSSPPQFAAHETGGTPTSECKLLDKTREIRFDWGGIINLASTLPEADLDAVNRICVAALRNEPLPASPALVSLKSATMIWRGQPSGASVPLKIIRPTRTLIKPGRANFQWRTATGVQSYTVHVVDDETQEEVVTSPLIFPSSNASICEWSEGGSLSPGKRYRWYVATVVNDQEIDVPQAQEPPARFSVLSEEELAHVNEANKANQGDQLIDGLLDLQVGLLDDAEADFQALLEEPSQTSEGKTLLRRLVQGIEKLKE